MRLRVKSEGDAFRLTYVLAFVVAVALLVGYVFGALVGIALLILIAAAALFWDLDRRDPDRHRSLREAERESQAPHGRGERRALLIANEAVAEDAVWEDLRQRDGERAVVEVLAPVLQSRTHFVTTDIDRETQDAHRRLEETLISAREHGFDATGEVGDPIDPIEGLADELRRYDVDEGIVATHPPHRANWVETDMLTRLGEELDIPLRQVVIDRRTAIHRGSERSKFDA